MEGKPIEISLQSYIDHDIFVISTPPALVTWPRYYLNTFKFIDLNYRITASYIPLLLPLCVLGNPNYSNTLTTCSCGACIDKFDPEHRLTIFYYLLVLLQPGDINHCNENLLYLQILVLTLFRLSKCHMNTCPLI